MFFLGLEVEVWKREMVGGRKEVGLVLSIVFGTQLCLCLLVKKNQAHVGLVRDWPKKQILKNQNHIVLI
jgi:hypothetical protein